jgi:uncharacterized phage protein gp47/JayE
MAYFPPIVTASGLSVPGFTDIQSAILAAYQTSYGSTTYLGNDSADYQWITSLALKLNDNMALCQLAYNSRSPLTAIGADLDSIIKLNGLTRLPSTSSTVSLLLSGVAGTVINNALVADVNGVLWQLPTGVTIGGGGSVTATAICVQGGAINAAANTVNNPVGGFTAGWVSVTNPSVASVGTPVESDSNVRARQSVSAALPSSTRLAGTTAEIKAVPGVTLTNILENQTAVTDSYGNGGHSMTAVVMGGTDLAVATAIFNNRGIGCNTQGATIPTMTIVPITDPNSGVVTEIGLVRPTVVPFYVSLSVHGLTAGFTTATQVAIINAIVAYLNSLQIGEEVTQSALYGAALSVMVNLSQPTFSIRSMTLGTAPAPVGTTDVTLLFFQVSSGISSNVILTVI